jgi:hypothetical protein
MTVALTILTIAVAVLAVLVAGLLRSHAAILRRLHELGAGVDETPDPREQVPDLPADIPRPPAVTEGRAATDLVGVGPRGEAQALRIAGTRHDTVLAFLSSGCTTCHVFWDELRDATLPRGTRLVIVTKGEEAESPAAVADVAPPGVTVVMSSRAWTAYEVPGSPYVVHVDGPSGRVRGEGTGPSWEQVRGMLLRGADDLDARRANGSGRKAAADARREQDVDQVLLAAGIEPGHPSLYARADGTTVEPPPVEPT